MPASSYSTEEVEAFRQQIKQKNYEVADSHATVKTRGSAQKAFADKGPGADTSCGHKALHAAQPLFFT